MQNSKQQSVLFSFIGLILLTCTKCIDTAHTSKEMVDYCPTQVCSYNEPPTRYVQFPFLIRNDTLPASCGYPGFDLLCDGADRLLVDLPNSGIFSVQAIDYSNQQLWLNDPDQCLPKRLLSLDLSRSLNSPFTIVQARVYWLYNCSSDYFKSFTYVKPIRCLSGANYSVVATSFEINTNANSTSRMCSKIGQVQVPVHSRSEATINYSDLSSDIPVTWAKPECKECFRRGGQCGFKSDSSLEVGCFNLPRQGLPRNALVAIALAFAAPLGLFIACIAYFIVRAVCYRRRRRNLAAIIALAPAVGPQPQTVINGLDRSTIESYPKVVLGESRRLPKPDDKSCPICLGEYLPKEALRTLPHCGHCFHADCIDEWLQLNASCPVCRNSPTHAIVSTDGSD